MPEPGRTTTASRSCGMRYILVSLLLRCGFETGTETTNMRFRQEGLAVIIFVLSGIHAT